MKRLHSTWRNTLGGIDSISFGTSWKVEVMGPRTHNYVKKASRKKSTTKWSDLEMKRKHRGGCENQQVRWKNWKSAKPTTWSRLVDISLECGGLHFLVLTLYLPSHRSITFVHSDSWFQCTPLRSPAINSTAGTQHSWLGPDDIYVDFAKFYSSLILRCAIVPERLLLAPNFLIYCFRAGIHRFSCVGLFSLVII